MDVSTQIRAPANFTAPPQRTILLIFKLGERQTWSSLLLIVGPVFP